MIDPITLSTATIAVLTPYLVKGGEQLVSSAASDLWNKVKNIFTDSNDEKALTGLITQPSDSKAIAKAEYVLEKSLDNNPELLKELAKLVEKSGYPTKHQNNVQLNGNHNVSLTDINGSTVNIKTGKI
jgi:hypothetical protein